MLCQTLFLVSLFLSTFALDPDTFLRTDELIRSRGFISRNYTVVTADGYKLGLYRVSKPGSAPALGPVYLQHGMLDTSATWVINSRSESLAYILVDAGYDVWLGNSRGNTYSLANTRFSPWTTDFWSFDWDQHAVVDVPQTIDFILQQTNSSSLKYVGHSQGATIAFAALSKGLLSKVSSFVALAPVTYLKYQTSPLLDALATVRADLAMKLLPNSKFLLSEALLSRFLGITCKITPQLCTSFLSSLFGDNGNLNSTRMGVYTAHWPDNTSLRNMIHWIQNTRSGGFNNLGGVPYTFNGLATLPKMFIVGGTHDHLANPDDLFTLVSQFPPQQVTWSKLPYAHMDFVWSSEASRQVYPDVLNFLK